MMRWRVVCALRETMLILVPIRRFSKVDLPTFGLPTMAMVPDFISSRRCEAQDTRHFPSPGVNIRRSCQFSKPYSLLKLIQFFQGTFCCHLFCRPATAAKAFGTQAQRLDIASHVKLLRVRLAFGGAQGIAR